MMPGFLFKMRVEQLKYSLTKHYQMDNILNLAKAYRKFLLELGQEFKVIKEEGGYEGFADSFIDLVKSPEVGFTSAEVQTLIKMYDMFCLLEVDELPSHHAMKLMVNKKVDMDLLESAQTLSVTDFKELLKDKELKTQDRTYKYEVIRRTVESGSINRVYGEELEEAIKIINNDIRQ
jgi:hypothetical protein